VGWTPEELITFLEKRGIPQSSYSIGSDRDEAYCLVREGQEWLVYYSERGNRNHLGWGKTEHQGLNLLQLFLLEAHVRP
jgi:hypothetical protein